MEGNRNGRIGKLFPSAIMEQIGIKRKSDDNRRLRNWAYRIARRKEARLAKLVVFKKGGGGKVAINPEQVTHVRSAAGAFTDVFMGGQQVAVEGSFEETVALLSLPTLPDRRAGQPGAPQPGDRGLALTRFER
jgi:hypothetical protein